jgi:hypothetical protein
MTYRLTLNGDELTFETREDAVRFYKDLVAARGSQMELPLGSRVASIVTDIGNQFQIHPSSLSGVMGLQAHVLSLLQPESRALRALRLLRDAGDEGIPSRNLAAALGYSAENARGLGPLTVALANALSDVEVELKDVRRIGMSPEGTLRWFKGPKTEQAISALEGKTIK